MQIKYAIVSLTVAILTAGCASTSQDDPPPKANRVQVLVYDTTPRQKAQRLDVYAQNQEPNRPYKKIALLTCEGRVDQEVVMTQAIFYRARMIGADGVIDAGAIPSGSHGSVGVFGNNYGANAFANQTDRCVFREYAIVYSEK